MSQGKLDHCTVRYNCDLYSPIILDAKLPLSTMENLSLFDERILNIYSNIFTNIFKLKNQSQVQ